MGYLHASVLYTTRLTGRTKGASMIISRTRDKKVISKILRHPKVNPWLVDDLSPINYSPVIHESIIYLVDDKKTGVTRFDPMNGICCQAHIATVPDMWGKAVEFSKLSIEWIFKHTGYQKIVAMIPEYNRLAIRVARMVDMKQEGNITSSFLKDWKLHSLIIFGLDKVKKETETCHS